MMGTPTTPGFSQALEFLQAVVPAPESGERIEGRYLHMDRRRPPARTFYAGHEDLVRDALGTWAGTRNCHFGVALRRGEDGTAAGCTRVGALWADIDAKLWPDARLPLSAAIAAVTDFTLPPSIVVHTGGGLQPYWLLVAPLVLASDGAVERLRLLNTALAAALCGAERRPDRVGDAPRVLRLPGTWNDKYSPPRPVCVDLGAELRRYDVAALERELGIRFPWAMELARPHPGGLGGPAPPLRQVDTAAWDLRARVERARIRRETRDLLDIPGPMGRPSASEADYAIACALAGSGAFTPDEAFTILLASERGADALRRKGERHGDAYLQDTIAKAFAACGH
jgi:hypothetical protein